MPIVTAQQKQRRQQGQIRQEKNWQTYWAAPRIWPNGMVYILGGGPSLRLVDIERLRGQHVIAINNAYQLGDWIDVCYFGDWNWFKLHRHALLNFAGLKVTGRIECKDMPGIRLIRKRNSPNGISKNPLIICWNQSSGGCAINLATLFGVKKIVLFGYDMRKFTEEEMKEIEKKAVWSYPSEMSNHNWHSDHKDAYTEKKKKNISQYAKFLQPFDLIAKGLQRDNIECINATPGSALTHFPIVEPESVL